MMEYSDFALRLARLREKKGVSARDMSLSLGQSPNYINHIENHKAQPSMQMFLYICEYLKVTPKEFFDTEMNEPVLVHELVDTVKGLSEDDLKVLISVAEKMKK